MFGSKKTKITLGIVLVIMLAVLASACNVPSSEGTTASQPTTASTAAPTEAKKVKISLWTAWSEESGMGDMIKEFNVKYPNIEVEHVKFTNTDDGNVKLDTSLMSGEEVNVFFNYGVKRFIPRAEKGIVEPLNDYMAKTGYDIEKENGDPGYKPDGKYYSLPVGATSTFVQINERYLKEAGLSVPPDDWTIEDYVEYAKKIIHLFASQPYRIGFIQIISNIVFDFSGILRMGYGIRVFEYKVYWNSEFFRYIEG